MAFEPTASRRIFFGSPTGGTDPRGTSRCTTWTSRVAAGGSRVRIERRILSFESRGDSRRMLRNLRCICTCVDMCRMFQYSSGAKIVLKFYATINSAIELIDTYSPSMETEDSENAVRRSRSKCICLEVRTLSALPPRPLA